MKMMMMDLPVINLSLSMCVCPYPVGEFMNLFPGEKWYLLDPFDMFARYFIQFCCTMSSFGSLNVNS